jgi:hypothetical protein
MGCRGPWCLGEACLWVGRVGEWLEKAGASDALIGGGEEEDGVRAASGPLWLLGCRR